MRNLCIGMKLERCKVRNYLQTKLIVTIGCRKIKYKVLLKLYFIFGKKIEIFLNLEDNKNELKRSKTHGKKKISITKSVQIMEIGK